MKKIFPLFAMILLTCQNEPPDDMKWFRYELDGATIEQHDDGFTVTYVDDFNEKPQTSSSRIAANATATPSTVPGNAESLLTITANEGVSFGTEIGRIYFNSTFFNKGSIIKWTDNEIITQVPLSNTGSYTVYVRSADGSITYANTNITVPWGVYTAVDSDGFGDYKRYPFAHVNYNGEGGETIHCKIGSPESFKNTIRQALQWWKDNYGYNIKLGEDVDATINNSTDGIMMTGIEAGSGLARASVTYRNCGDKTFYVSDGYFSFDSSPSVAIAAHEIGHFFGLGHSSGVMCGNTSCLSLSTTSGIDSASNYIMNRSVNIGVSCYPKMEGNVNPNPDPEPEPDPQPTVYTFYLDNDNDGYGQNNNTITNETNIKPEGYARRGGDCNDSDPAINPGAIEEPCNTIDENCDGRAWRPKCKGKRN